MQEFESYKEQIADMLAEVSKDGVAMFQNAIDSKRLIFTRELKQSFEYTIMRGAEEVASEITFRSYGRFKDMKVISYLEHAPPVAAMEYFIEKIGIEKFAWVPGYEGKAATTLADINRIAWAISRSKKMAVDIKRGYRGTWYNSTKMEMINNAKKRIRWLTSSWIVEAAKRQLEHGDNN
jgi:hypothetical protein